MKEILDNKKTRKITDDKPETKSIARITKIMQGKEYEALYSNPNTI